jgi:hypothetical protein
MNKKLQRVKIEDIKFNPTFRHATLPAPLTERIKNFMAILTEVFDKPLQEVIDGFRRDAHPEREVEVWEKIAHHYQEATASQPDLSHNDKQELFSLLLKKSMGC